MCLLRARQAHPPAVAFQDQAGSFQSAHPFDHNTQLSTCTTAWVGWSLPSRNGLKNPFSYSKKCSANKTQSIRAAVQREKPPLLQLSRTCFVLYLPATRFQHCFPTQASVTPMYFEKRLIKTAHLLYFDCPIPSLP